MLCVVAVVGGAATARAKVNVGDHPKLVLKTVAGKTVDLGKLHGLVLVDFWATWCAPCRKAFGAYAALHRKFGKKLTILAVNVQHDPPAVKKYLAKHPLPFPVLLDPEGVAATVFEPPSLPAAYLIDAHGKLRWIHIGFEEGDQSKLQDRIRKLLAARAADSTRPDSARILHP